MSEKKEEIFGKILDEIIKDENNSIILKEKISSGGFGIVYKVEVRASEGG